MNSTPKDKESLVYDLSIVKQASEDIEYLNEIISYFISNSSEMLNTLEEAIQASNWETAQNTAHKLSSNFFMFGLDEGAQALLKMEMNLLNEIKFEECPDLMVIARTQGDLAIMQLKRDFHS